MSFFSIRDLKCYFTIVENFITFILSIKVLQGLAWENRNKVEFLHFFINCMVESPIVMTWTISKFDIILLISFEEFPKFSQDCRQLNLIWVDQQIKDSLCGIYWIHDDDNTINVDYLGSLIDTTSDSRKFSLSGSNIDYMMESLDNRIIVDMDMSNQSGYLTFDACIWYYNSYFWISQHLEYEFIKFTNMYFSAFFTFPICKIKIKMTRKYIN